MTAATFRNLVARAGVVAPLGMRIPRHLYRHSTAVKLVNDHRGNCAIQHYLGHGNTRHTVLDAQLASIASATLGMAECTRLHINLAIKRFERVVIEFGRHALLYYANRRTFFL